MALLPLIKPRVTTLLDRQSAVHISDKFFCCLLVSLDFPRLSQKLTYNIQLLQ